MDADYAECVEWGVGVDEGYSVVASDDVVGCDWRIGSVCDVFDCVCC